MFHKLPARLFHKAMIKGGTKSKGNSSPHIINHKASSYNSCISRVALATGNETLTIYNV